jgi:hypothetical protein
LGVLLSVLVQGELAVISAGLAYARKVAFWRNTDVLGRFGMTVPNFYVQLLLQPGRSISVMELSYSDNLQLWTEQEMQQCQGALRGVAELDRPIARAMLLARMSLPTISPRIAAIIAPSSISPDWLNESLFQGPVPRLT